MMVAAYGNYRVETAAPKGATHAAQFHIGIRQYYTGSMTLNHLFFKKLWRFDGQASGRTASGQSVICARFCRYALSALH